MTDTNYNGWSNRATWNVNLWLANDEAIYHEINRLERRHTFEDEAKVEVGDVSFGAIPVTGGLDDFAEAIEAFCREIWPNGLTPDGDKLADADFDEIAAAWVDE